VRRGSIDPNILQMGSRVMRNLNFFAYFAAFSRRPSRSKSFDSPKQKPLTAKFAKKFKLKLLPADAHQMVENHH
jgi:hypothetical protein